MIPGNSYEFRFRDHAGHWRTVTDPMGYRYTKEFAAAPKQFNHFAVVPDLAAYNLEGLDKFFVHKRLSQAYVPNLYEWLVSLWVVSLWVVVFLLGTRWLPVIPTEKGGEQHAS